MKLIYTGDFERLKKLGFKLGVNYYFYKENSIEIIIHYDSKNINIIHRDCINDYEMEIPTIIYDLIQAGLVKKEEEDE